MLNKRRKMKTITDEEYKELLEWRKWEKILLEHPAWSLKIERGEK